ncbi:MAG: SGNH/GDSL hydrolase family protein [Proteobacteria bacterium]|nr:SGNH/GDSL hydrolase family protein [Pseudomonadota bacterium]
MSLPLKLLLSPILIAQAMATRRRAPKLPEAAGARDGQFGSGPNALRVLIAGDSSAAGVGVADQSQAFAGYYTRTLHRRLARPLRWTLRARSGYTTAQVHRMLTATPPPRVDVAVIVTGVNDVIDQLSPARALAHRSALAEWLLDDGRAAHVLFAALPPIHQFPLLPQPLRRVMGADARRHDAALAAWAAGRARIWHAPIDVWLSPATMADDGFHPGEPVYRTCGETLARFTVERILADDARLSA